MAIYGWIFSNAKLQGARLDYQVRGGYRELAPWCKNTSSLLPSIAYRLLSVNERNTNPKQPLSWFGGYLDRDHYAVAVGGTQKQLLSESVSDGTYRMQFCVFAYVLTGSDIHVYRQDPSMFAPLKKKLIEIQETGVEREKAEDSCRVTVNLAKYELPANTRLSMEVEENILKSSTETDAAIWALSCEHPVATGLARQEDARRFLDLFPSGVASVTGGNKEHYRPTFGKPQKPRQPSKRPVAAQPPSEAEQRKREREAARIEALRKAEKEDRLRMLLFATGLGTAIIVIAGVVKIVVSHIF